MKKRKNLKAEFMNIFFKKMSFLIIFSIMFIKLRSLFSQQMERLNEKDYKGFVHCDGCYSF